ncbi:lytic polysaccharide monooxygenase, partial [Streptomyces sp. NPDC048845]|uniref:lytic polysaccharide monooxygenase auxiliary activity family 9 protein n=1 Tax=Streptomyces sp. NPDC048845 TaxID=3155390 RepID=UPI003419E085
MPTSASAHGATMLPGSRTYMCYVDGIAGTGGMNPSNPACADAVAQSGTTALYNWFAVLDSNGGGKTEGYIPDGELCTGGNNAPFDFTGYDAARPDWPTTHLTAGETVKVKYSNWAAHPGDFDVYITKDGWTPDTPLAWGDLEKIQTVTNPPQQGGVGTEEGHYYWDLQLPAGKTGKHMIYIHWIRSDSPENFYSCSDVEFDGGNGEVTGLGEDEMSAQEIAEVAENFENTQAKPVHTGHDGDHVTHGKAVETEAVAATEDPAASSTALPTAAAVGGAGLVVFVAGAAVYNRRRQAGQQLAGHLDTVPIADNVPSRLDEDGVLW